MIFIRKALSCCNKDKLWAGDLLALIAGAAMPLGFAPVAWRLVPFLSITALILLLQVQRPLRAAVRGFWFGLGMFGLGVSWVYNSLYDYGSASVFVATLIASGLVLIMAAYIALVAYVFRRWFSTELASGLLLSFPAVWVLVEWLRSWLFTGFPWLLLGYSQVDTWLAGFAPVAGVFCASFIVCVVSGGISYILLVAENLKRLMALAIIVLLLFTGYGLTRINWTQKAGEPITVALVQGAIPQDIKMRPDSLASSLQRYVELTQDYLDRDLIIWPETAIHARSFRVEPFLEQMEAQLIDSGAELLTGIFVHDLQNQRYYNSLIKLGDRRRATYSKQRLVPFGEYMPFRGLLEFTKVYIDIPMSDISAAISASIIELAGHRSALGICYESAYQQVYRKQLPESAFMVNVSNDAWFGDSLAPHQHLEIARMRALEAARYLLRSTNTGISAVIDSSATVLVRSRQFKPEVVSATIWPLSGETWFVKFGNWPVLLVCSLILFLFLIVSRQRKQDVSKQVLRRRKQ